jgi:hypothetical protein
VAAITRAPTHARPPRPQQVTSIASDALFILLVEKDAAFMRLAEDRFYNDYPCIIITAKGQPDVATRCVSWWHGRAGASRVGGAGAFGHSSFV